MTIRRRLALSFTSILLLFALNMAVYFVGDARRQSSIEALQRAVEHQSLLSAIVREMETLQRQVSLLSQISTEQQVTPVSPDDLAEFNFRVESIAVRMKLLQETAQGDPQVANFVRVYETLSQAWRTFYTSFGVDQAKAITALAVHAEPLSQELGQKLLPTLQANEHARVQLATSGFYNTARIASLISLGIFLVSIGVAVAVAYLLSRHLGRGLNQLKLGFASIGRGNLDHRIVIDTKDELAELASDMNVMAGSLAKARAQLTEAHEHELQRSEQLNSALEDLKKAQSQLLVQERLASLGSLTAGIAHEIKNPLNFVTNFADLSKDLVQELRETLPPEALDSVSDVLTDLESNLKKINEHGRRADGIVKGMLMHSRGQSGDRQNAQINSLVSEYVKLAYHGMRAQDRNFNVTIDEQYDPSLPEIQVVPQDLSRVILNIGNNACYAAYAARERTGKPTIRVVTGSVDGKVEIRIRDNGDGVPESVRKKVFDPFYTTKPTGQGTGLGLSISYDIVVRQHGGELALDTKEGEFAEFIIRLPK